MKLPRCANFAFLLPASGHTIQVWSEQKQWRHRRRTLLAESVIPVFDSFGRPLRSLRISVTDRCNLRCQYCMPEQEYTWLDRRDILTFEEIAQLVTSFAGLGVDKVRLTGGEPLLRQDLDRLVRLLALNPRIRDLALTTNGMLLGRYAGLLREAGLKRLTVSLDTLRPDRFRILTRGDSHAEVVKGIQAARAAGFASLKLNSVIIRGFNDDELGDLIEFGREAGAEVRFIEYMDVGGATRWTREQVFPRAAMLESLNRRYGSINPLSDAGPVSDSKNGSESNSQAADGRAKPPADRYVLPDGTVFGVISSTTQPFCATCDRARLTPDGMWLLCLYASTGVDLKALLRAGAAPEEIARTISAGWRGRTDRGAEERLGLPARGVFFQIEDLRRDPHREMHTRGG
jgi:cyclic pyranopterin phosphate synthase